MLTVSRSSVAAGKTIRVFGRPCRNGATAALFDRRPVRLAALTRIGASFRADVAIPRGARPGRHALSTQCNGITNASATVRVVAVGGRLPAAQSAASRQGIYLLLGAIAALALLLTISITLGFQRHRTRTSTPGYFDLPSPQRPIR